MEHFLICCHDRDIRVLSSWSTFCEFTGQSNELTSSGHIFCSQSAYKPVPVETRKLSSFSVCHDCRTIQLRVCVRLQCTVQL